jgi:HTH-type transcriptional regulator/antitoxin HigA
MDITMIKSEKEHEKALARMEILIENYDNNISEIDILWLEIENYEETAPEFEEFNKKFREL